MKSFFGKTSATRRPQFNLRTSVLSGFVRSFAFAVLLVGAAKVGAAPIECVSPNGAKLFFEERVDTYYLELTLSSNDFSFAQQTAGIGRAGTTTLEASFPKVVSDFEEPSPNCLFDSGEPKLVSCGEIKKRQQIDFFTKNDKAEQSKKVEFLYFSFSTELLTRRAIPDGEMSSHSVTLRQLLLRLTGRFNWSAITPELRSETYFLSADCKP